MTPKRGLRISLAVASWIIAVSGCSAYRVDDSKLRRPNDLEAFYEYVAAELNEPSLCEKISSSAYLSGGWSSAPSLARSECYDSVARRYGDAKLCDHVKRLGPINLDLLIEHQLSRSSCLKRVARGPDPNFSAGYVSDVIPIFAKMGYRPEELHLEELADHPAAPARTKFVSRVKALPDFP